MALVRITPDTNRLDSFAAAHGLSETDVVRWNLQYFLDHNTFWLPLGEEFYTAAPLSASGRDFVVNGRQLIVNDKILVVT